MRLFETSMAALCARDRELWRAYAAPDGRLVSPYLLPEFADLVDAERGDVRVVIAGDAARPAGFFACHCGPDGVIRPVGAPLSDYQGFVGRPGLELDERAIMNVLGAHALVYDNWTGAAPGKVRTREGSQIIDLTAGPDAWLCNRRNLHRAHFKKLDQRARKAGREFGPAQIVFGDPNGERYEALKAWKSAQYRTSGLLDLFDVPWIEGVFARTAARAFGPFRGMVASLYLGEELAAVEIGLCAGSVYHSWIPAYDPRFASVSPGLLLLNGIIANSEALGLTRIDLGKGEQDYKRYYADYAAPLSAGRLMRPCMAAAGAGFWSLAEAAGGVLPEPLSSAPVKLRRRWSHTAAAEPAFPSRVKRMASAFASAPRRLAHTG
ncbi:GNAT family N-acetyltransferase [Alkalicaulis satelles]|nr:GNAT family N-acetyltransferase [Alkalicaulis satelles]